MSESPPYSTTRTGVLRLPGGIEEPDLLAVEEPLEIRIGGQPVAVTMRTPGHDEELALGFCLSEGLRPAAAHVPDDLAANTVDVEAPGFDPDRLRRSFYTTSSCGVCGKGALEAVAVETARVGSGLTVPLAVVESLPGRLRDEQPAFAATGGLHATGLFTGAGDLVCLREDVGRHNALDKLIGALARARFDPAAGFVAVTSRASYEMVHKAASVGVGLLAAISAPTGLAIRMAEQAGLVLAGFARGGNATLYSHPARVHVASRGSPPVRPLTNRDSAGVSAAGP
jgi:FdhD protein